MPKDYEGVIIEESLSDKNILKAIDIIKTEITDETDPAERWHLHTVRVSEEEIAKLSKAIKPKWYMHFRKGKKIIAVFKGKKFEFDFDDKRSWRPAVEYGLSLGIPEEQLNFPID